MSTEMKLQRLSKDLKSKIESTELYLRRLKYALEESENSINIPDDYDIDGVIESGRDLLKN